MSQCKLRQQASTLDVNQTLQAGSALASLPQQSARLDQAACVDTEPSTERARLLKRRAAANSSFAAGRYAVLAHAAQLRRRATYATLCLLLSCSALCAATMPLP